MRLIIGFVPLPFACSHAEDTPKFRTDADGPVKADEKKRNPKDKKPDDKPDWYQLVEGQFPPEGSAHAISGELMQVDHLDRRFQIRVDRNDSQDRGVWDLPLDADDAAVRLHLVSGRAGRLAGHSAGHASARPVLPHRSGRQDAAARHLV